MKEWICAAAGTVGGLIAGLFGGWDAAIRALLIFMAIDYLMGFSLCRNFPEIAKNRNRRSAIKGRVERAVQEGGNACTGRGRCAGGCCSANVLCTGCRLYCIVLNAL